MSMHMMGLRVSFSMERLVMYEDKGPGPDCCVHLAELVEWLDVFFGGIEAILPRIWICTLCVLEALRELYTVGFSR